MAGRAVGVWQFDRLAASLARLVLVGLVLVRMMAEVARHRGRLVCGFVCTIGRCAGPGELERQQNRQENEQQAAHGQPL